MTYSTQLNSTQNVVPERGASTADSRRSSIVKSVFVGSQGLRSGWRVLIFLAIACTSLGSFVLIRAGGVQGFLEQQKAAAKITITPLLMGESEIVAFLVVCLATLVMAKIEGRKFGEYGLPLSRATVKNFGLGVAIGFSMISGTLLVMYLLGCFHITGLALHGTAIVSSVAAWALAFLLAGLFEEFLFRGYLQNALASGIGFWPAALALSGLFGFGHAFNSRETTVGAISAGLFGVLLSLFLKRTGSLWCAIGFHTAYDLGQNFYGVPDSGIQPYHNVLSSTFNGPTWLTGGIVGPEAGILTPIALLVVALIFSYYHREDRYQVQRTL
jgi:hypothetical protein